MGENVSLMPHAVCWAAAPKLVWTMVVTNAITALSYLSICITLLALARTTRRVIARDWGYFLVGFALFIVACGSTHLLEVITTWTPIFWVDAWTNIITAVLSAWVAFSLARRSGAIGFGVNDYADRLANTEREKGRIEESLLAAQRLEEWSRMSTVMAHEINNPLEAVQNLLYVIRSTPGLPAEAAQHAEAAQQETARVIELTRSTLGFFRQGTRPETVDLGAAAESVRFLITPLLQKRTVELQIVRTGDLDVHAYPGEVRQVLLNLVRNACEATTTPGTQVTVELTGSSSGVEIVVSDHGSGIPPAVLPSLFQFGASTKGQDGNGMGLWTVKHILNRHAGTIRVDSIVGEGTRFVLFWPREFPTPPESSTLRMITVQA
ncbi:MAG: HAMP domain-containing histidine kinase [Acidobacteriota bacterium]|nr:HAMP domain-containing histidine kinase [Acidobacteriota bacterium]